MLNYLVSPDLSASSEFSDSLEASALRAVPAYGMSEYYDPTEAGEAYAEDDDFVQAGTLVREVLDDEQRARLASNIVGHVLGGVSEPVLSRVFEYWKNVDPELGKAVEEGVRAGLDAQ